MKTCRYCSVVKTPAEFNVCKRNRDGLHSYCKACRKLHADTRRPDIQLQQAKWYAVNRDKVIGRVSERSSERREEIRAYGRAHYLANPEKYKEAARKSRNRQRSSDPVGFRSKVAKQAATWRKNHPHIVAWRNVLKAALARMGRAKTSRTSDMLGYTSQALRVHIERLWTPGMNWGNYGEWHIDHIKPLSSFSPEEDMGVVNALANLQPLWATARFVAGNLYEGNLNKGSKPWV